MSAKTYCREIKMTEYAYFCNYSLDILRFRHYMEVLWDIITWFAYNILNMKKNCANNIFI